MCYIVVKTYGNGKHMNAVHSMWFEWLSQAERVCEELNGHDGCHSGEKWIVMPLSQFKGSVW